MRTASSSLSYGMIASTGPKISSCAIVHLVVDVGEDRRLDVEALRQRCRTAAAGDELGAFLLAAARCSRARCRAERPTRADRAASWDRTDRRRVSFASCAFASSMASACRARGTSIRVHAEQVCPEFCMQLFTPAGIALSNGASSSTTNGDLPPSSSVTPLDALAGERRDTPPGLQRAGEAHHVDIGMTDDRFADDAAGAADDVEARRRAGRSRARLRRA